MKLALPSLLVMLLSTLMGWADDKSNHDSIPSQIPPLTCSLPVLVSTKPDVEYTDTNKTTPMALGKDSPFASIDQFPSMQDSFKWQGSGLDKDKNGNPVGLDGDTAYIFHVTSWAPSGDPNSPSPQLVSSTWYLYSENQYHKGYLKKRETPPFWGRQPLFYGLKSVVLYVVQVPDNTACLKNAASICYPSEPQITVLSHYSTSVTQQTPDYISDGVAMAGALLGLSGAGSGGGAAPSSGGAHIESLVGDDAKPVQPDIPVCSQSFVLDSSGKHLPYDIAFTFNQSIPSSDNDASKKPTDGPAITRTIHALNRGAWGWGMGVDFPFKETQISDDKGTVTSSVSHRINVYAFGDFHPAFWWRPKNYYYPHILGGMPINGQPLHRLFAGLAQPLPLETLTSFPISIFGGAVFLREQQPTDLTVVGQMVDAGTFQSALKTHWVRKTMFGIEVPVGQLLGKIKSK